MSRAFVLFGELDEKLRTIQQTIVSHKFAAVFSIVIKPTVAEVRTNLHSGFRNEFRRVSC